MIAPARGRLPRRGLWAAAVLTIALGAGITADSASATTVAPGWQITSVARPTNFAQSDTTQCQELGTVQCDRYELVVTNVGGRATEGPITIVDTLPTQVKLVGVEQVTTEVFSETEDLAEFLETEQGHARIKCSEPTVGTVSCTYGEKGEGLALGSELAFSLPVEVTGGASGEVANEATIEGGGATAATTSPPSTVRNTVNGAAPGFGVQDFHFSAFSFSGGQDLKAGDHPGAITTGIDLNSAFHSELAPHNADATGAFPAGGEVKDIAVELPLGFVGNPQAAVTCPETTVSAAGNEELNFEDLEHEFGRTITRCPAGSVVGALTVEPSNPYFVKATNQKFGFTTPLYNVATDGGYPAEFGFSLLGHAVFLFASVIPTQGGYRVRVASPGIARLGVKGVELTLFGEPNSHDHTGGAPAALFTNPTACSAEPLTAKVEADSWQAPGHWVSTPEETVAYPEVGDCNLLQFEPTIELSPETSQADTPSGYDVTLKVPQTPNVFPNLATPDLKDATVELPDGVTLSPSAADGLEGCAVTGPVGIDIPHGMEHPNEAGEGEEVGPDGLSHLTPGHCPAKSKIGEVEVTTPLLATPLHGHLYLAQPKCGGESEPACTEASATNGELYGLYLEAEGSGVIIKLRGTVSANPSTGQLTATFRENPQLPFSDLKIRLAGGPRAPLANPQACGTFTTSSDLTPWSAPVTPGATPSSSFAVSGCTSPMPFAPSFSAGTLIPIGGGFSPFTLTFSRQDGEQDLAGIAVRTPPGLLGKISEVPLCGEPQAREGTCPPASRIGTTNVAAGAGSHPFWLSGSVYLTSAYKGAPFGLSIVVPEKAGPFNLGNEVVRAAINVDSHTSALTVTSDPLPQHKDGVPFRLKTINVTIDRPNFIFNPTNCSQQQISGTIAGTLPDGSPGSRVPVSSPFAVAGCKNLPFKPKFTVLTQAKTSKANGASLHVKVVSGPGQANIGKVKVDLPKQLPSRLTTLQQACPDATFNANPASCPAGSLVGTATAVTPVLKNALTGPAYLVSHAAAAFPDVVIVLQGEGITLDLVGNTDIKKGITISTFNSVPDAPISTFDLVLPEGPHSALAAYGNLCKTTKTVTVTKRVSRRVHGRTVHVLRTVTRVVSQPLSMPTALTGQNGAVVKQTTKIAVSGCPKYKAKKSKKAARKHKKGSGKRK